MPRISVVVLTHNRAALLEQCLASLDAQTRRADQIVVVDNASTDGTRDLLARRAAQAGEAENSSAEPGGRAAQSALPSVSGPAPLTVVAGRPERGWAATRNQGVRAATGDWVAFLDDDCEAGPEWLAALERTAAEGFDAVGGVAVAADPLRYPWWWHGDMAWAAGLSVPAQLAGRSSGAVYYPSTSCLAVLRPVLLAEPFQEIPSAHLAGGSAEPSGAALRPAPSSPSETEPETERPEVAWASGPRSVRTGEEMGSPVEQSEGSASVPDFDASALASEEANRARAGGPRHSGAEPSQQGSEEMLPKGGEPSASSRASLYAGGREDAELWRRLRRSGYRCVCDPAFRVRHHVPQDRLRWGSVLGRAYQDGVALQRREPREEFLANAFDTLWRLPVGLVLGIWRSPDSGKAGRGRSPQAEPGRGERIAATAWAPWRDAAWRIVWAGRQAGQWREAIRRAPGRAAWLLVRLTASGAAGAVLGAAKWGVRKIGTTAWRVWREAVRRRRRRRGTVPAGRAAHGRGGELSVAVAASGFVGDTVLLHPFLTGLRERRPEATITLITNPTGECLYRHDPAVQEIVTVGAPDASPQDDSLAIRAALAKRRVRLVLIPYWYGPAPGALFSRPEARIVTFAEEVGFARRWWYDLADRCLPKPAGEHEGAHLYRLFREAGFEGPLPSAPLAFVADEVDAVTEWTQAAGLTKDNLAVVAPGSAKREKCWPNERWADVVRYLADEYSLRVCIAGSAADEPLCSHIAGLADRDAILWCGRDLRQVALMLAGARLVVGTDTGLKHLAAAVDTPTLTLFGPTDERQWGALRHPHRHGVVRGCAWDLTAEERVGLPPDHQMRCIATARVLAALDEMLSEG